MRIVSGKFRGRPISAPKTQGTRPTTDKARESLFNILSHASWSPSLDGARILDLFAGSGALGLEALSRGAGFCVFVETGAMARGAIRANIEALELFGQTRLQKRDATRLGAKPAGVGEGFDLVFLDPPYGKGLALPAISSLLAGGWLKEGAILMVETGTDESLAPLPMGVREIERRQLGRSVYVFMLAQLGVSSE